MKFFSRLRKSKILLCALLLLGIGLAFSYHSQASSSRTLTKFFTQTADEVRKSGLAMLKALRGEIDDTEATIETSPTLMKENLSVILLMTDQVVSGGVSKEVAGELLQVGQKDPKSLPKVPAAELYQEGP